MDTIVVYLYVLALKCQHIVDKFLCQDIVDIRYTPPRAGNGRSP